MSQKTTNHVKSISGFIVNEIYHDFSTYLSRILVFLHLISKDSLCLFLYWGLIIMYENCIFTSFFLQIYSLKGAKACTPRRWWRSTIRRNGREGPQIRHWALRPEPISWLEHFKRSEKSVINWSCRLSRACDRACRPGLSWSGPGCVLFGQKLDPSRD